jgi:hypothetical protein
MPYLLHLQAEPASSSVLRKSKTFPYQPLMISIHPNGNIAEFLTSAGLAKVIDVSLLTEWPEQADG